MSKARFIAARWRHDARQLGADVIRFDDIRAGSTTTLASPRRPLDLLGRAEQGKRSSPSPALAARRNAPA